MTHNSGQDTVKSVALFTRAWIEIINFASSTSSIPVALFTRAWIEMTHNSGQDTVKSVALFTRAWIEMYISHLLSNG